MDDSVPLTTTPSQDERIMAALSHGAVLIPIWGIVIAVIVWITQKDKSKYTAFQSLQALVYQLFIPLVWFLGMGCYMLSFFASFLTIPIAGSSSSNWPFGLMMLVPFATLFTVLIGELAFIVFGLVGAVMVLRGKDFRYIILGRLLERYMQNK